MLLKEDEIRRRKATMDKSNFGSTPLENVNHGDLSISKNDSFYQDKKKSTYLTECFANFITYRNLEGFSNQPNIMTSSAVSLTSPGMKHAWLRVLTSPWISERKRTVKKLETIIWVDSYLQYSKCCVALCGYPLVMLSSSLVEYSEFSDFFQLLYKASLTIGYLSCFHLLLDKILAWYCKQYLIVAIDEDFFRLDVLDNTTYFLYHQCQSRSIDASVMQNSEYDSEDDHQSDISVNIDGLKRGHLFLSEYERKRMLTELLSNSNEKLSFRAFVGDNENLQREMVSISHECEKALPVVNKSFILTQLNTALKMDFYTCGVLLAPFILIPTHQMCIFAYGYFILLEYYYHRKHLNLSDVLKECKQTLNMELVNLSNILIRFYGFI